MVTQETKTLVIIGSGLATVLVLWMSCGDDSKTKRTPVTATHTVPQTSGSASPVTPAPTPPAPTPNPPPEIKLSLSPLYQRLCSSCHGATGEGTTPLRHTQITATQFQTTVRYGMASKGMPSFDTATYDNTNMSLDYQVLTAP